MRAARSLAKTVSVCIAAAVLIGAPALPRAAHAGDIPTFAVDASWPKPLPNNWIIGQVGGITVDSQGHIWVIHRPRSLTDDEKGATLTPPRSKCCVPAPPVLEFDTDGNLLRSWGGPGEGYEWVGREHGIEVDDKRLCLARRQCRQRQRDPEIHPRRQIRRCRSARSRRARAATTPRNSASPPKPRSTRTPNEIYVADGYGNHRVIVFDATTGAYKRHWGAYGNTPDDDKQPAYDPKAPVSQQFGNPVHCVKIANDGLVYVCDRINDRIQVFKKDGTFVKEWFYEKNTLGNGAVWDLAIWPDPKQTYLLSADGENNEIRVLKRDDGTVVGSFGHNGRNAGQFHWVHAMAVDAKGNVYTAEVDTGKRIQKFKLTSDALR